MSSKNLLNEDITFAVIKVIKPDGMVEIMNREDALNLAKEKSLDLWLVCEDNFPPLCATVNYQKLQNDHTQITLENKRLLQSYLPQLA